MINVYIPLERYNPLLYDNIHNASPFYFEKSKFNIVNSLEQADIIPLLVPIGETTILDKINYIGSSYKNKWIVVLMHTHANESESKSFNDRIISDWIQYTNKVLVVDLNQRNFDQISYDFCWNRQKVYFTEYDSYDLKDMLWTGQSSKKMFSLTPIPETKLFKNNNLKKFLMPNKVDKNRENHPRNVYRKLLLLTKARDNDCFWSNWDEQNPNILLPEEDLGLNMFQLTKKFTGWLPVANRYYDNSFISVYVETITETHKDTCSIISEKTFDPLIKGHFILPFGYTGMIDDLKQRYGFRFPDWIDYSYDDIGNHIIRYNSFLNSIDKIRNMSFDKLTELYNKDRKEILEYNRNLFFTRPYDSLYDKIKSKIYL